MLVEAGEARYGKRMAGLNRERFKGVMGGSSGVLLSIFASAAGLALQQGEPLPEALKASARQMQHFGGANEGDRTMMDALLPALRAFGANGDVNAAAAAARVGADATAKMRRARAGRPVELCQRGRSV